MKVDAACAYLGGISPKTLYRATRAGDCKAAKVGAGRNYLWCEEFLNDYAIRLANKPAKATQERPERQKRLRWIRPAGAKRTGRNERDTRSTQHNEADDAVA
jgi:hypothetical protein